MNGTHSTQTNYIDIWTSTQMLKGQTLAGLLQWEMSMIQSQTPILYHKFLYIKNNYCFKNRGVLMLLKQKILWNKLFFMYMYTFSVIYTCTYVYRHLPIYLLIQQHHSLYLFHSDSSLQLAWLGEQTSTFDKEQKILSRTMMKFCILLHT